MRGSLFVMALVVMPMLALLSGAQQAASKPASLQTATPAAEPLQYGNSVKRTFEDGSGPFIFTFQAQAGDLITLTMVADRGQQLDPALVLIDPQGNVIAQNDDSFDPAFGPLNARLVNFPIPANGTYTIQAMRSTGANGSFTLMLRGNRSQNTNTSTPILEYGQSGQGTINSQAVRISYQFHADPGDVITITVQTAPQSSLIPYIVLVGTNGSKLTSTNPAERTSKTARITRYPIQEEGIYTIIVSRVGEERGTSSGDFKLLLTRDANYPVMSYGDTVEGTLDDQRYEAVYLFNAEAGDVVTITMARTSGTLDATLSLVNSAGRTLATNDQGSGAGLRMGDARISKVRIVADGPYTIVAGRKGRARGTTMGSFSLTVKLDQVEPRVS
jgi:hypothetical protein